MITEVTLDEEAPTIRETHTGLVFLLGDRAYKIKKSVTFDFVDFSTRALRLAACLREVELNRRLAPDVYDGVIIVTDVHGEPADHLVAMRRMPESARLSTLVRSGVPLVEGIRGIGRLLAAFHANADRSPEITEQGTQDALLGRWRASLHEIASFRGTVLPAERVDEIGQLVEDFLAGRADLFAARADAGRIVDGHGDLLAEDIFLLDDGPRILDCLEFDDRLRSLDGLDDVAFLAMDLERLGAPELRDLLLDSYAEYSGDPAPPALREHYLAYRAFVRAKVACLRYAQHDRYAAARARFDVDVALRHLRAGEVRLILVGGLPGTGKTTLAGSLADRLGAVALSSDRIRKENAGLPAEEHAPAPYHEGIYSPDHTEATYHDLLHRAEALLALGETVILDASWPSARLREQAADAACRAHSRLVQLHCTAPTTIAEARLRARPASMSDADAVIAAAMTATADPWPDAIEVSTADSTDQAVVHALAAINERPTARSHR